MREGWGAVLSGSDDAGWAILGKKSRMGGMGEKVGRSARIGRH